MRNLIVHAVNPVFMSKITEYPLGPSNKISGKLLHEFIDLIQMLTSVSRKYGEISYFRLGREHIYLVNDPDMIEKT